MIHTQFVEEMGKEFDKKFDINNIFWKVILRNLTSETQSFIEIERDKIRAFYAQKFSEYIKMIREEVENIPDEFPEIESDDFDNGVKLIKKQVLLILEK